MDQMNAAEFQKDVALPPANFQIWPSLRIGALTIDVLLLIIFLLLWFIPRIVYKTAHLEGTGQSFRGIYNQYKMWGFWVSGFDAVYVENNELTIISRRGMDFCSEKVVKYPVDSVQNLELKKRNFFSLGIVWAFFISCLVGIWLHFIPCIWWTCDWSYFDGQGVRGAIWFVSWGLLFIALILFYPIIELELVVQPNAESSATKVYMLAVGEGCARSRDDKVALHDLDTLKQCMIQRVNKLPGSGLHKAIPKYVFDEDVYQYTGVLNHRYSPVF